MNWGFGFFCNSVLLGVGLAMDAFSISVAGGLRQPGISRRKMAGHAGVFAFFQFAMPMVGWLCVHTIVERFRAFEKWIPWIALVLLVYIGGRMLVESLGKKDGDEERAPTGSGLLVLLAQGIATSIDALSVGFTIAGYTVAMAFVCSLIIAAVTFLLCLGGFLLGRTVGDRFAKAEALGGAILICIGLEIFLQGVL